MGFHQSVVVVALLSNQDVRHRCNAAVALFLPCVIVRTGAHLFVRVRNCCLWCSNDKLQKLVSPHVDSFNFFLTEGLDLAVADLARVPVEIPNQHQMMLWIESAQVGFPTSENQITGEVSVCTELQSDGVTVAASTNHDRLSRDLAAQTLPK